jgi:hypothetical protein
LSFQKKKPLLMSNCSFNIAAVVLLSAAFAIISAATGSVQNEEWAPIQTVSEPVPFAPEFLGQHSEENNREVLRHILEIRKNSYTRSNDDRSSSGGSPFASLPKIASVTADDTQ